MPWDKTRADRERDKATYGSAEYKRNRAVVMRRSGGKCEVTEDGRQCGSRDRVQCDHITPVSQGGTHHIDNLRAACHRHHSRKTAQEGGGYRRKGRRAQEDPPLQSRTEW
jgi:5-methylcytosine-specific restriction endonuclease McrA